MKSTRTTVAAEQIASFPTTITVVVVDSASLLPRFFVHFFNPFARFLGLWRLDKGLNPL